MMVYLLSVGRERFELYSEPPEEAGAPPAADAGRLRQWAHTANVRWHELVEAARRGRATGRIARWRDALVRRLAETIAEQRTLWALAPCDDATLLHPASLDQDAARTALNRSLTVARRHHGMWLLIDGPLFVVSAALAPIPGPNVLAYYLGFRAVGHWLSWRGARHASVAVKWTLAPDTTLDELAALINIPRAVRASRVHAIAARLKLHRLEAFFERVAA